MQIELILGRDLLAMGSLAGLCISYNNIIVIILIEANIAIEEVFVKKTRRSGCLKTETPLHSDRRTCKNYLWILDQTCTAQLSVQ